MAAIHCAVIAGARRLGAEAIVNGDFSTTSTWTQSASEWVISGGKANYTAGGATALRQPSLAAGATWQRFRVVFTVSSISSGGAYFSIDHSGGTYTGQLRTAPGTYTEDVDFGSFYTFTQFRLNCTGTACSLDDVSMRSVL